MSFSSDLDQQIKAMAGIPLQQKYNPDQPRDEAGRFASGGGGDGGTDYSGHTDEQLSNIVNTITSMSNAGSIPASIFPQYANELGRIAGEQARRKVAPIRDAIRKALKDTP